MKKIASLLSKSILFLCSLIIIHSCSTEEVSKQGPVIKSNIKGLVQKGPFVNGTQITINDLDASLNQTGKSFSSQISSNDGAFSLNNVSLTSGFVRLSTTGYYFNEITGSLSEGPLSLFAISDLTDLSSVNVNIMTHLEKERVEKLFTDGMTLSDAKKQAQQEILAIFGLSQTLNSDSENLNITANGTDNAFLLAISCILQGNRSVGELTELLATISSDLVPDGVVDDQTLVDDLLTSAKNLDLASIRINLLTRYQNLGITNIPDFESVVESILQGPPDMPSIITNAAFVITYDSAKLNAIVNPNGSETTVTFEYGKTLSYGSTISYETNLTGFLDKQVQVAISGLDSLTEYHFRVKAENSLGLSVGEDKTFTTPGKIATSVTDIDGNIYNTVVIGNQVWMRENLKVSKYQNGDAITNLTNVDQWMSTSSGAWSYYDNNPSYELVYGRLYNWYCVTDSRKVCPSGWHVPNEADWTVLTDYLGEVAIAGGKLKEAGTQQ